jgi:hypothetical protein
MKTPELVDKYQKLLAGLLKTQPLNISFEVRSPDNYRPGGDYVEIGSITIPEDKLNDKPAVTKEWCLGEYRVMFSGAVLSTFKLYQMPHCCGIIVFCNAEVSPKFRNKRVGTTLNTMRMDIGRNLGYSLAFCTDITANAHQGQLLKTNGWRVLTTFKNRRTGNEVHLSCAAL